MREGGRCVLPEDDVRRVVRRRTHETEIETEIETVTVTRTTTTETVTTIVETITYSDGTTEVLELVPGSFGWVAARVRLDRARQNPDPEGVAS